MGGIGVLIALGGPWVLPFFNRLARCRGGDRGRARHAAVVAGGGYQFFDGLNMGSSMCLRGAPAM